MIEQAEAALRKYDGPGGTAVLTYEEAQAALNLFAWVRTVREAFDNELFSEWARMKRENYEQDRVYAKARYEYLFPNNNAKELDTDGHET